jgi:hypothetical protein
MSEGIYKLVTDEGDRRHAWRTTEANARRYADLNDPSFGDRLVDPTGRTVHTYGPATPTAA